MPIGNDKCIATRHIISYTARDDRYNLCREHLFHTGVVQHSPPLSLTRLTWFPPALQATYSSSYLANFLKLSAELPMSRMNWVLGH